jgi:anhydro-N-acetylmuramic acid kinase
MDAIAEALAPLPVSSTAIAGVDPDFVEAALFAWLARERLSGRPGNRPEVTGADGSRLLGAIHAAPG